MSEEAIAPGAVIGLGRMGTGMAQNLMRRGFRLSGYDVDRTTRERFAAGGGRFAADPAGAARDARFLLLMVLNAA